MRVLFVMPYGALAASSRTRVYQYFPYLDRAGISYDVLTVFPDARIHGITLPLLRGPARKVVYYVEGWVRTLCVGWRTLLRARRYDVLFFQRAMLPPPVPALLRWRKTRIVYDFDDATFTTDVTERSLVNRIVRWRNSRGLPPMLRTSAHAIVENDYTRAYAERYCPRVSTITGPIDTDRYRPLESPKPCGSPVVLGWIGSPTTEKYLETIRRPLEEVGRRFSNVRLVLVGASSFEVAGLPTERLKWDVEREVADLRTFDIGLMPLPDDEWTRGKGGYKLLQYMAVGIPAVTSPVGVNRVLVSDGADGFWAAGEEAWTDRLCRLIRDADLRRNTGAAGRRKMEREYALSVSADRWIEILKATCPDPSASSASSTA
ncbi:MAG: glycosyltransferase family 1 protein [Candidatus Latescibacteria bacterium]|nr:glycosyltransferase family 1 protein [Candidatus Latescibacterota bacterium]